MSRLRVSTFKTLVRAGESGVFNAETRKRGDAEVCRGRFLAVGLVAWSSTIVVERLSAADVAGKDGLFEWGGRTGKSAHPTGLCFDVGQRTIWIWMTWSNRMRTGRPEKSALVRALA